MTEQVNHPSRREVLKWFASIPFLPLGAMATSAALTGCNDDDNDWNSARPISNLKNATFTAMPAPDLTTAAAMATTTVTSKLKLDWEDGSNTEYQLDYKAFFNTGDQVAGTLGGTVIAGGYYDIKGNPIIDRSVPGKERQFFSDCPDGSSLLQIPNAQVSGVKNPIFHVVQFEYNTRDQGGNNTYGRLPSPIAVLTLDQDQNTGHLELKKYFNIDTSKCHGLWITCGASLSPWGSHLSSEEYEPDAFDQGIGTGLSTLKSFSKYTFGDENVANPYHYGHLPEVTVLPNGTGTIKKHYCLGRISHEIIQMMPDERTALMGDDYTNGGLFMFVADRPKDLSAGTLYVAKYIDELNETSTARIQWIRLGHATSDEIENLININKIQPTDIFDSIVKQDPNDPSFTQTYLSKKKIWLRLKPNQEKAAAFLETHRYAALKGASMGFSKLEGTTVNVKDKVAYSAVSYIQDSMVRNEPSWSAANNIAFAKKISAGGILAHDLKGEQFDSDGVKINSDWVPYQSYMLIIGQDIPPDSLGNTSDPNNIACPDNIKFSETLRTLFIGEDSGTHVNNFLWAYNVDTKKLNRILSAPAGAESTGLHAVDSINGWTYIMSNFQHPGDWEKIHHVVKDQLDPLINQNYKDKFSASVGYITADPIAPSAFKK